jgi:hypothetical protein
MSASYTEEGSGRKTLGLSCLSRVTHLRHACLRSRCAPPGVRTAARACALGTVVRVVGDCARDQYTGLLCTWRVSVRELWEGEDGTRTLLWYSFTVKECGGGTLTITPCQGVPEACVAHAGDHPNAHARDQQVGGEDGGRGGCRREAHPCRVC